MTTFSADNLSVVIFTTNFFDCNRPNFLERQLVFWSESNAEKIVLDTSTHELLWQTSKIERLRGVTYIQNPGASLAQQLASARGSITRPYVVFITDDDVYLLPAVCEAVSCLRGDDGVSTCNYNGSKLIRFGKRKHRYSILWSPSFMENKRALVSTQERNTYKRFELLSQTSPLLTWEAVKTWGTVDLFLRFCSELVALTKASSYVDDLELSWSLNEHLEQVFDALSIATGDIRSVQSNGILHWSANLYEFPPTWVGQSITFDGSSYAVLTQQCMRALERIGITLSISKLVEQRLFNRGLQLERQKSSSKVENSFSFSSLRNAIRAGRLPHETYLRVRSGFHLNCYLMERNGVKPNQEAMRATMKFMVSDSNRERIKSAWRGQ